MADSLDRVVWATGCVRAPFAVWWQVRWLGKESAHCSQSAVRYPSRAATAVHAEGVGAAWPLVKIGGLAARAVGGQWTEKMG